MEWIEEELELEEIGGQNHIANLAEAQLCKVVAAPFGFKAKCLKFDLNKKHSLGSISIELYWIRRYNNANTPKMYQYKNIEIRCDDTL